VIRLTIAGVELLAFIGRVFEGVVFAHSSSELIPGSARGSPLVFSEAVAACRAASFFSSSNCLGLPAGVPLTCVRHDETETALRRNEGVVVATGKSLVTGIAQ
jgi:hypothetical protein